MSRLLGFGCLLLLLFHSSLRADLDPVGFKAYRRYAQCHHIYIWTRNIWLLATPFHWGTISELSCLCPHWFHPVSSLFPSASLAGPSRTFRQALVESCPPACHVLPHPESSFFRCYTSRKTLPWTPSYRCSLLLTSRTKRTSTLALSQGKSLLGAFLCLSLSFLSLSPCGSPLPSPPHVMWALPRKLFRIQVWVGYLPRANYGWIHSYVNMCHAHFL